MAVYTAIDDPEAYFQVKLYSGTGSSQSITLDGSEDMAPNMIWIKERTATSSHVINDSVRGVQKNIQPNSNAAESGDSTELTAFNSNGFTYGSDGKGNESGQTYVAWNWVESATAGFDIVLYTGNGTDDTDISHSLSAVPKMILVKRRDGTDSWLVQHGALGATKALNLEGNGAVQTYTPYWSDETPTSSVFTLGDDGRLNGSSETYVAYLWSEKQGFSKFGSFVANSNVDGPFIFCGFKPSLVIGKVATDTNDWFMFDAKRSTFNPVDDSVYPNTNAAENTNHIIDFLSNGFKIRDSDGTVNSTGNTYIYMAFAEAPFVNSNGVPCNAR